MKIFLNEKKIDVNDGVSLKDIHLEYKPTADILVYNGAIQENNILLKEGDSVMLIKRGEELSRDELEYIMAARHTPGVHNIMKNACVGIAGLGGLGSSVAIALARIGIGKLILVDFDVVEPSNLNRQQYFIDQLGMYKADALLQNLERINPYVNVETYSERVTSENLVKLFSSVDILVEAFDRPDQKAMLLESAGDFTVVAASGLAGYGSSDTIKISRMGKNIYIVGDLKTGAAPGLGLMAPRVGIAAHMQANLVMQLLMEKA